MKHLLNIFCGLMLLFPFAANCQTDLKDIDPRDIKVEISNYGDTTRYYYDENDNKTLEEFVEFQTKVFQNINSKGEFVNDSLKKVKDLNEKKAILTK